MIAKFRNRTEEINSLNIERVENGVEFSVEYIEDDGSGSSITLGVSVVLNNEDVVEIISYLSTLIKK